MKKKLFVNYFYRKAAENGYPSRIEQLEDYSQLIEFMHLTCNDILLDVGCGAGTLIELTLKKCWSVGLDIMHHGSTHCIVGEGEALPFCNQSFSIVCFSKSFALMEMDRALMEAHRVTIPEGRLIVRELVGSSPYDDCLSWICDQLLKEDMLTIIEHPYISEITSHTIEEFISPWWHLSESMKVTTKIIYPSEYEFIDRLLFYSALSTLTFDAPQNQVELLRHIITEGVRMFYKESFSVETTYFIIEALKCTP